MSKLVFFSIFALILLLLVAVGGSYLTVYWRDTRRRWRIENEQDERRRLQESLQDMSVISEENKKVEKF